MLAKRRGRHQPLTRDTPCVLVLHRADDLAMRRPRPLTDLLLGSQMRTASDAGHPVDLKAASDTADDALLVSLDWVHE